MIKRRYVATVVMSVGVLGKLDAAAAYAALPENARESLSTTPPASSVEQEFHGPIGRLNLTPGSPHPAVNMADGDDRGDDNGDDGNDGQHHRRRHSHHGDDGHDGHDGHDD
jgi:hypothetical protein